MEIIMCNISLTKSIHLAESAVKFSNDTEILQRAFEAVEYYLHTVCSNEYLNSKYSLVLSYFAKKLESKLMGLAND